MTNLSEKMNSTFVEVAKGYNYDKDTKQWLALYNLTRKLGNDVREATLLLKKDLKLMKLFSATGVCINKGLINRVVEIYGEDLT